MCKRLLMLHYTSITLIKSWDIKSTWDKIQHVACCNYYNCELLRLLCCISLFKSSVSHFCTTLFPKDKKDAGNNFKDFKTPKVQKL